MRHDMEIVKSYPTGVEEWRCPLCGRWFILQQFPFKRIDLEIGDRSVYHYAVTDEKELLRMDSIEITETFPDDLRDQINNVLKGLD